jgi:hypothetical protein
MTDTEKRLDNLEMTFKKIVELLHKFHERNMLATEALTATIHELRRLEQKIDKGKE